MPGIVGIFSADGIHASVNQIRPMCEAIQHRPHQKIHTYQYANLLLGRVGSGAFHKNATPKETDALIVFLCGELLTSQYERRALLGGLVGESGQIEDVDLLIGLYTQDRRNYARHLRGSFNAFIVDKAERTLTIINDRFGFRPLYYYHQGTTFAFASEVNGLLRYDGIPKTLNLAGLADFFHFGFLLGNKTYFTNIELLAPGSTLTLQDGNLRVQQYWSLRFAQEEQRQSEQEYAEQLASTIKEGVQANLQGSFRYGLPLSGGLDSRTIAACVPQEYYPLLVYTWGMPNSVEVRTAKKVADQLGLEQHNMQRTPEQFVEHFAEAVMMTDGMIPANLPLANFLFEKAFMPYVDICLDGLQSICPMWTPGFRLLSRGDVYDQIIPAMPKDILYRVLSPRSAKIFEQLAAESLDEAKQASNAADPVNTYHHFDITQNQRRLASLAHQVKRNFVEIRAPLFDYPIIDLIQTIPSYLRRQRRLYYRAFCQLSSELARIETVGTTVPVNSPYWLHLAGSVRKGIKNRLYRSLGKLGIAYDQHALSDWGVDYDLWYSESPVVKAFITKTLTDGAGEQCEHLNVKGVKQVVEAQAAGRGDYTGIINRLLTFVIWRQLVE
jgi:asparagine synthase (glutamine-hydrolysing)